MAFYLAAYIACLVSFLLLDALWLGAIARRFYQRELYALMRPSPRLGLAAVFYVMYAAAIVILAISPAMADADGTIALLLGAVLGAAAYGTYDITNQVTLKDWPWSVTLVDLVWGTILTATSAFAGHQAAALLASWQ